MKVNNIFTRGGLEIGELKFLDEKLKTLRKISHRLHRFNEIACNDALSERQEKRKARLKENAQSIAENLGYQMYFQNDPRGCALYLIPLSWTREEASSRYPDGMAIY